jgi:hypothetical protein
MSVSITYSYYKTKLNQAGAFTVICQLTKEGDMMKKFLPMVFMWSIVLMGCPPTTIRDGALIDVNPTSPTFKQDILPADFHGMISAWYFGHAT